MQDIAHLLVRMGVDKIIMIDSQSSDIGGFFGNRVTCDNLDISVTGIEHIFEHIPVKDFDNCVIVSPDTHGIDRAKSF